MGLKTYNLLLSLIFVLMVGESLHAKCVRIQVANTSGAGIRVRTQPYTTGSAIHTVREGESYAFLGGKKGELVQDDVHRKLKSDTWLKIDIPSLGRTGYMAAIYAKCSERSADNTQVVEEEPKKEEPKKVIVKKDPVKEEPKVEPAEEPKKVEPTEEPKKVIVKKDPTPTQGNCEDALDQDLRWPVPTNKTVFQGFKEPSTYMSCGFHTGLDIRANTGAPVLAIGAGKVVHVGHMWLDRAGTGRGPHAVIIDHGRGRYSTYGHNQFALVQKGDCVKRGQAIGGIGSLGYSFKYDEYNRQVPDPHLHFEVVENNSFTGYWKTPFNNVCNTYRDPIKLKYRDR